MDYVYSRGVIVLKASFFYLSYQITILNLWTQNRPIIVQMGGWVDGRAYVPFHKFNIVESTFLLFLLLKGGVKENDFKIGMSTFKAILELLGWN